jgi:hypothetical protein
MKFLILASLIATNTYALNCEKVLQGKEIWEVEEDTTNFKKVYSKTIAFPHAQMNEVNMDADEEWCKEAKLEVYRHLKSGETFKMIFTSDDSCDGGNSFGYIADTKDNFIATIGDSFMSCIGDHL